MKNLESFYFGKKVLVSGGAGFIGSHLVERLVALGAKVAIIDNFSSGNLKNLQAVFGHITIHYADITSSYHVYKSAQHQDIIFHLAALVSVPYSIQHEATCYKINVDGTKNLLDAAVQNNISSFVYASSSAVYGDREGVCNEADVLNPLTPYAKSKQQAEELCALYAREYQLKTAALRYFNVYGDRQLIQGSYAAVVAKFKQYLREGLPLPIYGDGNQTRDFIHVDEVVNATLRVGAADVMPGDIFNIGSGKSITLFQLIELLKKELAVEKNQVSFEPVRVGDIRYSQSDCKKYQSLLKN